MRSLTSPVAAVQDQVLLIGQLSHLYPKQDGLPTPLAGSKGVTGKIKDLGIASPVGHNHHLVSPGQGRLGQVPLSRINLAEPERNHRRQGNEPAATGSRFIQEGQVTRDIFWTVQGKILQQVRLNIQLKSGKRAFGVFTVKIDYSG